MKPVVAIVGRPNVGKSTLFNRLVGRRVAIVESIPGVTRDRLILDTDWNGVDFTLIETGGIDFSEEQKISRQVRLQAKNAIAEADLVLFVVDIRAGVTAADNEVAEVLHKSDRPVLVVANKAEKMLMDDLFEFYSLGFGEPIAVSAAAGLNIGDLLDNIVSLFPEPAVITGLEDDDSIIKVAVVGRPNVGKSTLVNTILGEERVIVDDVPGTTRDAIDSYFEKDGKPYLIIDTAGVRRKSKINIPTERYSVVRAFRAIDRSDVVLILFDPVEGVTEQDKRIAGYAHEAGKASVLVMNKWDLMAGKGIDVPEFTETVYDELSFMRYSPVVFASALTGRRVSRLTGVIDRVNLQRNTRITTGNLNSLLREAFMLNPPPSYRGKRLKLFYAVQNKVKPPTFILFVNDPKLVHFSYLRFIENKIREAFGFEGTPIRIIMNKRNKED
ncbi:MAG TPA: ribosome biogenesis GTPase Der [Clostridia bacterium]|nr:ribosome biogenesis GTPase Der [Clostridia bacterium]